MWQAEWEKRKSDDFVMVSVAMDAQGWERSRRFVDAAGLTFPAAADRAGALWGAYGFSVVPIQLYFDETGRLVWRMIGGPKPETFARLDEELAKPRNMAPPTAFAPAASRGEAQELFARGVAALEAGERRRARKLWTAALAKDPGNWLIRKQVWALDAPERFYGESIDAEWQRERATREGVGR